MYTRRVTERWGCTLGVLSQYRAARRGAGAGYMIPGRAYGRRHLSGDWIAGYSLTEAVENYSKPVDVFLQHSDHVIVPTIAIPRVTM
jgi:hypothetical protein